MRVVDGVLDLSDYGSAPAAPPSGRALLYFKSGTLYRRDASGESAVGGGAAVAQASEPGSGPVAGALWYDTDEPGGAGAVSLLDVAQTHTAKKTFAAGSEDSTTNPAVVPGTTRAPSGQTADIYQWLLNGTVVVNVGPDGLLYEGGRRVTPLTSRLTSAATTASTTYAATGLSVTLAAGKVYEFRVRGQYMSTSTTVGMGVRIGGTATATAIRYQTHILGTTATTGTFQAASAMGAAQPASTAVVGSAPSNSYPFYIDGLIRVNAAGTLTLDFMAETTAATITIHPDSYLIAQEVA